MAAFGENFDLQRFKAAFDTTDDIDAYNRAQTVERALGRVQNFVADLAQSGVKLAQLPRAAESQGSAADQAFTALRNAGVIDGELCRRLIRAQDARSMIEHAYTQISAGKVHQSAKLIHDASREFMIAYRPWIEAYLGDTSSP